MPTAGRLAGAVIFGLFGWYLAGLTIPFFPESNAPDYWIPASAGISLIIGWRVCGSRAGQGYNQAVATGITAAGSMAFCLIFVLSFNQMISNAMRLFYNGPVEAVMDIATQMLDFGLYFYDWGLIATLFIGAVVCAFVTEFFGQRFP
jgi:hypothetical protein